MANSNQHSRARLCIISSANGSTFDALVEVARGLPIGWHLITDRPCGIEGVAQRHGIPVNRIEERENHAFSRRAASFLESEGIQVVLLLFWRVVTAEIFLDFATFNLHPSLLPEFPGLGAVGRARATGAHLLGATLHVASKDADQGRILAQTSDPVDPRWPASVWMRVSFRQRVRLAAYLVDRLLASQALLEKRIEPALLRELPAASPVTNIALKNPSLARSMNDWINKNAPLDFVPPQ